MNKLLAPENYELLSDSLPARDLAYSLARIYIGMAIHMCIRVVLFCLFMVQDGVELHKYAKKERGKYPAIFTEEVLFYGIKNTKSLARKFLLGYTASDPEVANHRAGFGTGVCISCPFTGRAIVAIVDLLFACHF